MQRDDTPQATERQAESCDSGAYPAFCKVVPPDFHLSTNHLMELLQAGKLNIWEFDLNTGAVFDFGYSESLSLAAGYPTGTDNIDLFYNLLHEGDRELVEKAISEALQQHTDYYAEFRIKLLSGEYQWVSAHGRHLFDADNKPFKLIGTWKYISEKKRTRTALI